MISNSEHIQDSHIAQIIRKHVQAFAGYTNELNNLLDLIGDASFVLIGEASHGTHEYYQTRAQITKRLIEEKGFNAIAVEADWPDAWRVNRYVKGIGLDVSAKQALNGFQRFPTWMWRNADVLSFVEWLKRYNDEIPEYDKQIGFYGLDLYSLYSSASAVVNYLERVDRIAAERARKRYRCLEIFGPDEQAYGYAGALGLTKSCQQAVMNQLIELYQLSHRYMEQDGRIMEDEYFFVQQNARVIANAEEYYRQMFIGELNTWNLRDMHMAETLESLNSFFESHNQKMKVVVWAHNSHLGDARATERATHNELNLGQLLKERHHKDCFSIGFTGYTGTVTAASSWGGVAERKYVLPALPGSYEELFHKLELPSFILALKEKELVEVLKKPRLQRAIGVIYMPQTERLSHYFYCCLPQQFDAIVHFQESDAVEPLERTPEWESGEHRIRETID